MTTKKALLSEGNTKIIYYQYKPFIYPVVIILACLFVSFQFIVPQAQQWIALQGEITNDTQKLNTLKSSLDSLSVIDQQSLTGKLQIVSAAVPATKDYVGILSAISYAAATTGISLDDYAFEVGELSVKGASPTTIPLTFTIKGDIDKVSAFLTALKGQKPLSSIDQVTMTGGDTAEISANFYAKSFAKPDSDTLQNIQPLSQEEESIISKLATSDNSQQTQ